MTLEELLAWWKKAQEKKKASDEAIKQMGEGEAGAAAYKKALEAGEIAEEPRVLYKDMPPEMQLLADNSDIDALKAFLLRIFPIGTSEFEWFTELTADDAKFTAKVREAIHAAKWAFIEQPAGVLSPYLLGADFEAAFYSACKQKRKRHDKALDLLSTSSGRQVSITHPEYQYALSLRRNKTAYIRKLDGGIFDNLRFNQQGQLEVNPGIEKSIKTALKKTQDAQGFDTSLLQQIFTAVYKAQQSITPTTITIHVPTFCREMGIDIHSSKANDIFSKLKVFENCMGVLGGNKYYAVLTIIEIDPDANTMTFAAPYMNRILMEIANRPAVKKETKAYQYQIPGYSWLIHSAIVSERNEPAKQIVNRIIAGLLQRGGKPDNKLAQNKGREGVAEQVTYSISFATLVNDAPILQQRITQGTTADKNKKLKRAFEGAYSLLKTRTDAYKYFIDLTVQEIAPTMTTLDRQLLITHRGINPAYKAP